MLIGGMPEVVATYAEKKDLLECQSVLVELTESLKNDFTKYWKSRFRKDRCQEYSISYKGLSLDEM